MSSSSLVDSLKFSTEQILIYFGFFTLIIGLIGNVFNIIIFSSLKTFRETTCAFYLTIASLVNIFQLLAGLLSRILGYVYNIDATKYSMFFCKIRVPVVVAAGLIYVLIQVVFDNIFTLVYVIYYIYSSSNSFPNPVDAARDQLISSLTIVLYYLTFAASFYIYVGVSARFRHQFMHVFINRHHLRVCCQNANQVVPQLSLIDTNNEL